MPKTGFASACRSLFLLLLFVATTCSLTTSQAQEQIAPELFSYQELVQLYEQPTPNEALQRKLRALLNTPFVSNTATRRGVKPLRPSSPELGPFLRVAFWNIERGLQYEAIESALGGTRTYAALLHNTTLAHSSA